MNKARQKKYAQLKETYNHISEYRKIFIKDSHKCYIVGELQYITDKGFQLYNSVADSIFIGAAINKEAKVGNVIVCFLDYEILKDGFKLTTVDYFGFVPNFTSQKEENKNE